MNGLDVYKRQIIYKQIRADIGHILSELCKRKGVEIIAAECMPDHVHMFVSIPPKYSVSEIMGYLKGKSSLMIFDRHANLKYKYGNRHFWCRGYYAVSYTHLAAKQAARLAAQRKAIDKVLVESLLKFSPEISESEIWNEIGIVHKINVAGLSDYGIEDEVQGEVIKRCLSAHQSWIKSSGHSFRCV